MSGLFQVDTITDSAGTGAPSFPNGISSTNMTDWTSYSLVITGSVSNPTLGTTSVNQAFWRRVADTIHIKYNLVQTSSGSAGSGAYLFSLPMGLTIDSSKQYFTNGFTTEQSIGFGMVSNNSGNNARQANVAVWNSTNIALTTVSAIDSTIQNVGSTLYALSGGSNTVYAFHAFLPIVGWS